jgi:hypothetical protein
MKMWIGPLLMAVALLVPTAGAEPRRFVLAIVRLDGRVVPFASYDGHRWERAWPDAVEAIVGTPTIDNTPSVWRKRGDRVPTVWHVWPASGASPIRARVSGVEVVEAHCSGQVALKTDLPAVKGEHALKFGVAVDSPSVSVNAIGELRRSGVLRRAAERTVVVEFSKLEAAQAQADGASLPVETPAPVVRITSLYRQAGSPRSPLYFVAEKKYRTPHVQDPGCAALTIMTGWLVPTDAGTLILRDPRVFLTDCDAKELRTALPLAALRVSKRLFWVLQEHGYEDETYVLAEIGPSEVRYRIEVNGGGC